MVLKVTKEGIVKYGYDARSLVKAGYYTSTDYCYDYLQNGRHFVYYMKGEEKVTGGTVIQDAKGLKIYNISNNYELVKGEKTKLRKNDKVQFLISLIDNTAYVGYVTERKLDLPLAKNRVQMYNSSTKQTTRTPDADGYYVFELAINGQLGQYKTKDKAVASRVDAFNSAFAVKLNGDVIVAAYHAQTAKDVSGLSVGRFDVTSIKGNRVTFTRNRPTSGNYGEVMEKTLSKKCKIYDISPYAESFGAEAKLELGDRVEAYANGDGQLIYIYIVYACTRKDGPISLCEHCNKEVWWEPYVGDHFDVPDLHYYFPGESTVKTAFSIGANEKPVIVNGTGAKTADLIDAYLGVVFEGRDPGDAVTVQDTNPIAQQANAQTFPTDGSDCEAMCYACNEVVLWKAFSQNCVWHKLYDPGYDNEAETAWHSHFYVPHDITVTRKDKSLITNVLSGKALETSTMCIHLNGKTITSPGEIRVEKSVLNIMGNGTIDVSCTAQAGVANGTIYISNSSGKLNLYGGTYKNSSSYIGGSVVFDLNGQKVYTSGKLAQVYGTMDLLDMAGGGTLVTKNASKAQGGLITVGARGVVNLYSGTLTSESAAAAANGGLVFVYQDGTFNMLGGTITGAAAEKGGNVCVAGAFNLLDGTISNGSATNGGNVMVYMGGAFRMEGGRIMNGNGSGSNVYISDSLFALTDGTISGGTGGGSVRMIDAAVFHMSGGTVTGGSGSAGGNFYLQATNGKKDEAGNQVMATLNLSGGTISGGVATTAGGNISLQPNGKLVQTGGVITGGTAPVGGNIAVNVSVTSRLTLGGTVTDGDVYVSKANTTTLSGKVILDRLVIEPGVTVNLDQLTEGANIKVRADGSFTKSNANAAAYLPYFTSADAGKTVACSNQTLVCYAVFESNEVANRANLMTFPADGSNYTAMCPVCNQEVTWRGIKNGGRASSTVGTHFYLAENGSYSHASNAFIYNNAGASMCFHLNGKTFTTDARVEAYKGTLNMMGNGELHLEGSNSKSNALLYVASTSSARLNVYGGTYTAASAPVYLCTVNAPVNIYESAVLNGDVEVRLGSLHLQAVKVNGTLTTSSRVTLSGKTDIQKMLLSLTGSVTITESWKGNAVVDFPVYEPIGGAEGYGLVYRTNATLDGALNGSLKTSAGKYFTVENGRLKVETDRFTIAAKDVPAVAAQMQFMTGQSNGTVTTAYCPACNKLVDWIARANDTRIYSASGTHFYMTADSTLKADNTLFYANPLKYDAEVLCVHLNGRSITAKGEIYVENGTLNIMGNGKITTDGTATTYGTTLLRVYDSVVNLFGGDYTITARKPLITFRNTAGVLNAYGSVTFTVPEGTDLIKYTAAGTYHDYREAES